VEVEQRKGKEKRHVLPHVAYVNMAGQRNLEYVVHARK
jgi:hypothetical protein